MIDRENAIENLEQNIRWIEEIECHKFPGWLNVTMAMRDAAELLKEQEPMEPGKFQGDTRTDYFCRNCTKTVGTLLNEDAWSFHYNEDAWSFRYNFCPYCGREVKWDD